MFYPHTIKGKVNLRPDLISEIQPPVRPGPVCRIDTTITGAGTSTSTQFRIPLITGEAYFCTIDWGDGTQSGIDSISDQALHTYAAPGQYEISISGIFPSMAFNGVGDAIKMVEWEEWKIVKLSDGMFSGCKNITFTSPDVPDVLSTSLEGSFKDCALVTTIPGLNTLDVTGVTNMTFMFDGASVFNQDLNSWNTSALIQAEFMFRNATAFNGNISSWVMTNVSDMAGMFINATSFNIDISGWDISNVISIGGMFLGASSFNQPIGAWTTTTMGTTEFMFMNATSFNQDLSNWDVSNVLEMQSTFEGATAFNGSLLTWDTGMVETMNSMFKGASVFNQPINHFDVTNVTDMEGMLDDCGMNTANYDGWLAGLRAQGATLQTGLTLGAQGRTYSAAGAIDRTWLATNKAMTFVGDSPA